MLDSEMRSLHLAPKKTTQLVSICGSQVRPCSSSEDLKTRPELALLEISFQQEIHGNTCFQYSRRNTVINLQRILLEHGIWEFLWE